ncbi:MAG: sulfite exporter TauE/SafE family protein [Rhodospirillaceae bacterium]
MDLSLDFQSIAIICFGLGLGAFVKGLTGMGLPLVAVPFMASFLGAEHAVVVMQIPGLVSNIWLVWRYRRQARSIPVRHDLILPAAFMTVVGVWFLDSTDDRITILLLAAVVAGFLALLLFNPSFRLDGRIGRIATPVASLVGGFVQGASGVSGPLFSSLILSFRLSKEAYVFYNGLLFGLFNIIQIVAIFFFGMWTWERFAEGCLALVPLFVFQFIGMRMMGGVSPRLFTRVVIGIIFVMEIKLVWEGLYV